MGLNKAQKAAIMHFTGPCLVLAGPGSGKTLTIAKRIEYLIKVYKVRPEEILVITFTKYAAGEMKQRFCRIMGTEGIPVNFGTFHSVYYWILKWAYGFNQGNLLLEDEKSAILKEITERMDEESFPEGMDEDGLRELSEEIGNVKNNRKEIESYESRQFDREVFREIYLAYEAEKKKLRKIDFEDMLILCCRLFEERADILEKWRQRFRYILIDEFQDINRAQYDAIRMLAAPSDNIFAVGDDDQSVYGFRGASPGIMMRFKEDYPKADKILLDVNYRSGACIVKSALRVISHNRERFEKEIAAAAKDGKDVEVLEFDGPLEESLHIVGRIKELEKEGVRPEQTAVLFRTAADAGILTELLSRHQIPFCMREKIYNMYEHFAAQDMMSYLKLAQGDRGRAHFLRIVNKPNRYISRESMREGPVTFESLRSFYCDKGWMMERIDGLEQDVRTLCGKTPYAAMQYIRKCIGYDGFLKEYAKTKHLDYEKIKDMLDQVQESSKGCADTQEWLEGVERYGAALRQRAKEKRGGGGEGVALHTMHGAKGLEYDNVFIIGANEGNMPYKKAKLPKEIEEERRLFYVAVTRAKKRLAICHTRERNGKNISPSRFIFELKGSQNGKNDVK